MCHADTNSHPTVECHDESHVGRTDPRVISAFWATGLERNAADLVEDQEKDESSHAYVRIIYCPSICVTPGSKTFEKTSMDFSSKRFKQGKIQKRKTKCSAGHCTIQNITKQVCKCSRTFVARETLASQKAATICAPKRASSKLL